jgi:hypothetical protein
VIRFGDDHVMTVRTIPAGRPAVADVRMRPVVLDTGAPRGAARHRGQAARAVLGVALATVLAAGAVAAGGWSFLTAVQDGTPPNHTGLLWYATPPAPGARDQATGPTPAGRAGRSDSGAAVRP